MEGPAAAAFASADAFNPQAALVEMFFPGLSPFFSGFRKYLKLDLYSLIPIIPVIGASIYAIQYTSEYIWNFLESSFMSTADIRIDDEMYNIIMAWVASQQFAHNSRKFVASTNLNSRSWRLYRYDDEDEDDEDGDGGDERRRTEKLLQYTPSFGTHHFWWRGGLFLFKRSQNTQQAMNMIVSEREEISICSFSRDPTRLKALLEECRRNFLKNDHNKTLIYRGSIAPGSASPQWTRSMSRISRPFSTVVLDEAVKKNILDDMEDFLRASTRRWFSNRGIPYRRGLLFAGPPGCGKSSLAVALAGYFKLKIYTVSLNSPAMNEENLGTLFMELPKRCLVLLEDIDTAGLTQTREGTQAATEEGNDVQSTRSSNPTEAAGRLSLSALLNVIDGVASQEGRILIMTTNHVEKLDKALIRPGRVDITVNFGLADSAMIKTIFKGIFASLDGDVPSSKKGKKDLILPSSAQENGVSTEKLESGRAKRDHKSITEKTADEIAAEQKVEEARIAALADDFESRIPSGIFSPAEIQGLLLKCKRAPERAVAMASDWVKKMEAERKEAEARRLQAEEARTRGTPGVEGTNVKPEESKVNGTGGDDKIANSSKTEEKHVTEEKNVMERNHGKEEPKTNGIEGHLAERSSTAVA
ncbi:MAG: hypothetical protein M1818_001379 [Claussenomyces sp. TS43310]|nr:MAG: hypothetical protein M1818_001379 [Claussenomyces sp. TS43310]